MHKAFKAIASLPLIMFSEIFFCLFLGVLKVVSSFCVCVCAAPGDRLNGKRWMLLHATGKDNE